MKPFFCYYGGKWRAADVYPKPEHSLIIEPFAGAAGYSTRYADHEVLLCDANPRIAALWDWLIRATREEIESLPIPEAGFDLRTLPGPAKELLGFWYNGGSARGRRVVPTGGSRNGYGWSESIRARIAEQVERIKHWNAVCGSYESLPNVTATWFIDPPYAGKAGRNYTYGSHKLDYARLAEWCRSRRGQVIVCEAESASWLPFKAIGAIQANSTSRQVSREAVWVADNDRSSSNWLSRFRGLLGRAA